MLLARENDAEIRNKIAKPGERVSSSVNRRSFHMAVGTDAWRRTLAREELLPVTTETRLMFRILSHIRKRIIALAHVFPILGWKRVT